LEVIMEQLGLAAGERESPEQTQAYREEVRQALPFFWVILSVLLMVTFWSLHDVPGLRSPGRLLPFTGLVVIHGALHWLGIHIAVRRPRLLVPYFLVQAALIAGLTAMARHFVVVGLYLGMAGEAIGMSETRRPGLVVGSGFALLAIVTFGVLIGWESVALWFGWLVPMLFFAAVYIVMYNRQIKARQEAQELLAELQAAHVQLGEYAARVEDLTRAAERQRMARELHDTLAQGLAGLILQLEAADSHVGDGRPEKAQAIVQQAMSRARTTLGEARRAIDDLRGDRVDASDLVAAIEDEARRFSRSTGIPCEVKAVGLPDLSESTCEHLHRIVAESLSNVARHAQAGRVTIQMAGTGDAFRIEIADDGVGVDPEVALSAPGHYGVLGMRERARLLGGTLSIAGPPEGGTVVRVEIPLGRTAEVAR
jgi:NarL family two-component system sensor histidine kinase YdfH